jgi:hypothetical protein
VHASKVAVWLAHVVASAAFFALPQTHWLLYSVDALNELLVQQGWHAGSA